MLLSNPLVVDPRVHKEERALVIRGHDVTVIVWDRHGTMRVYFRKPHIFYYMTDCTEKAIICQKIFVYVNKFLYCYNHLFLRLFLHPYWIYKMEANK